MKIKKIFRVGFVERLTFLMWPINLWIDFEEGWKTTEAIILFIVADALSSYCDMMGWTMINPKGIITFTTHQKLKCSTFNGTGEVLGAQTMLHELSPPKELEGGSGHQNRVGPNTR